MSDSTPTPTRITTLTPEFVEFMPETKERGILYVSDRFELAIHLCACGCYIQTVTPTHGERGWTLTRDGDSLTFAPSMLNPCGAHYFVRNNEIVWA